MYRWFGYVTHDNEVVVSRYFSAFDLTPVKDIKNVKSLYGPFYAEDKDMAIADIKKWSNLC